MADKKREQKPLDTAFGGVKREFSAGGAVYKRGNDGTEWLVIQPAGANRWQLPKGHIEDGESAEEAAAREVFEETGVKAKTLRKISDIQYFYQEAGRRIFKKVNFFLMEYLGGLPKSNFEVSKVAWKSFEEAEKLLTFKSEKDILRRVGRVD